jgi:hypothetical protein
LVFCSGSFQLSELKLGELLDTPPPGLDEAMAISKVRANFYELFHDWIGCAK